MFTIYNQDNVEVILYKDINQWEIKTGKYALFTNDKATWLYDRLVNKFIFDSNFVININTFGNFIFHETKLPEITFISEAHVNSKIESMIRMLNFS